MFEDAGISQLKFNNCVTEVRKKEDDEPEKNGSEVIESLIERYQGSSGVEIRSYSDSTLISGKAWSELKTQAMKPDYFYTSKFVSRMIFPLISYSRSHFCRSVRKRSA